ncbi:MAG: hypothetical protein ACRELV_10145 [Longimicrobiales bacterium]
MFLEYEPRRELANSLSAASVVVVTERQGVAGLLVPSKTYRMLASGRPILFIASRESDVAEIVEEVACGFVVGENDSDGVVYAILALRRASRLARVLAGRARRAERRYGGGTRRRTGRPSWSGSWALGPPVVPSDRQSPRWRRDE